MLTPLANGRECETYSMFPTILGHLPAYRSRWPAPALKVGQPRLVLSQCTSARQRTAADVMQDIFQMIADGIGYVQIGDGLA